MLHGTIIVATDENWLIGNRPDPSAPGEIPWQGMIPADTRYFINQTIGKPTLMTRPTYLSIPAKYRPLRDRQNVIVTRQEGFKERGCIVCHSFLDTLNLFSCDAEIMIAGGGELYEQALTYKRVDMVLRTIVHSQFEGNVYFPPLGDDEWVLIHSTHQEADEKNFFALTWETYVRREAMIVDPRNARSPEYATELLRIQRSRKCPFCPGGKTLVEGQDPILAENDSWIAIQSHTPIANSDHHWVIFPKRHVTDLTEQNSSETWDFLVLLKKLQKMFGGSGDVLCFSAREGNTEITGATVRHIHFNVYVPTKGDVVTVHFGPFPK